MPKKAGMEKWKKKRHQEYLELKKYRYYIFCEGQQTEPQYFAGFKKIDRRKSYLQRYGAD